MLFLRHGRDWADVSAITALALIITAVEIKFSDYNGLLAYPPHYDGAAYMLGAVSLSRYLISITPSFLFNPGKVYAFLKLYPSTTDIAPLWILLMVLNLAILGQGEWQLYTVHFWPTLLLLGFIWWLLRPRKQRRITWLAIIVTAVVPTISIGIRSNASQSFLAYSFSRGLSALPFPRWDNVPSLPTWYLGDLRPDLLFSVLLLWCVVPLIDRAKNLDRRTSLLSGIAAGLAVLTKATVSAELCFAFACTEVYVLIVNRTRILQTIRISALALIPALVLMAPWLFAGGGEATLQYLVVNLFGSQSALWVYSSSALKIVALYWIFFSAHMGDEGWIVLAVALTLFSIELIGTRQVDSKVGFLVLALLLYVSVTILPLKNNFIGLPFYLLLWAFSWKTITHILQERRRAAKFAMVLVFLYVCLLILGAFSGVLNYPLQSREIAAHNRIATEEIAADLRSRLTNRDCFVWAWAYGYPAALQFYMVDRNGGYPPASWEAFSIDKPPSEVINNIRMCRAILAYDEDIDTVAKYLWPHVHPLTRPNFQAIAQWVRQSNSSYVPIRSYAIMTPDGNLTLRLYIRS